VCGPFKVKLEIRFPAKQGSFKSVFMPGNIYPDGDYVRFFNPPAEKIDPHLQPLALPDLAKAVWCASLRIAVAPIFVEGMRNDSALRISSALRHEVETTETEGKGGLTRDDARRIYSEIIRDDNEPKVRWKVFEDDFGRESMGGYGQLAQAIGERPVECLRSMLHGYDRGPLDAMQDEVIFLHNAAASCVDLSRASGSTELVLYDYAAMAKRRKETVQFGKKRLPVFTILQNRMTRRQADDAVSIPGYTQGGFLYQRPNGTLATEPVPGETNHVLVNTAPGWATPLVNDRVEGYESYVAYLDWMLSWFTNNPFHIAKIKQLIAYRIQNPLKKPQFALALAGGQGIGKSTFFVEFLRALLGPGVRTDNIKDVFEGNHALSSLIGAALLVIEEADAIPDFMLAKKLHREGYMHLNPKYGTKGMYWVLGTPIYLTNKPEPKLNEPGEIDRTLYIIRTPTQYSLGLTSEEWLAYQRQRTAETDMVRAQLWAGSPFLLAMRQYFEDYPVTYQELTNTSESDGRKEDYRTGDLSAEQRVMQIMLSRGYIHSEHPSWTFDSPFPKEGERSFNAGFNELYQKIRPRTPELPNELIAKRLKEMFGSEMGTLQSRPLRDAGGRRVYWFPQKLGTLRERFASIQGVPIPGDTEAETGPNEPSIELCKTAWIEWRPKNWQANTPVDSGNKPDY